LGLPKSLAEIREYKRNQARRLRALDPERVRKYKRDYYAKHRKDILEKMADRERKLRERCLELYGFKCANCGFSDRDIIEFDHIVPLRNRKERRGNYDEILKHPEEYQPLCPNCHKKKTLLENQEYMENRK